MSQERLERNQMWVYAAGIVLGVVIALVPPGMGPLFEHLIYPVLGILLYATFLQVPFRELRRAFSHGRYMAAVLTVNFLVVPVLVWILARFVPQEPAILLGVYLVLLAPCIDYVIVFTGIGGGDDRLVLASAPVLMLVQMLLLPLYLWLLMGERLSGTESAGPFLEAFLLLIALPLGLAVATEAWAASRRGGTRWTDAMGWVPVPFMALTLLVVIASQLPKIKGAFGDVAQVVPVYMAYLVLIPPVAYLGTRLFGLEASAGRALLFTAATRNSLVVLPLALALPPAYALTPAVVVTQTMVELVGLLIYMRLVPQLWRTNPAASTLGGA